MDFRNIVIEEGVKVSYSAGNIVVTNDRGEKKRAHLEDVSLIMLGCPHAYISAFLLSECAKLNIPIIYCDDKYLPTGISTPLYAVHNSAKITKGQIEWGVAIKKQLWQYIVKYKITMQALVAQHFGHAETAQKLKAYASSVKSADSTNREAVASRLYFKDLFEEGFTRQQENGINACLDFGYSILLSKICREIVGHGYSTIFGIFHESSKNQWNLACDFIEPFRPLIDYIILSEDAPDLNTAMKTKLLSMQGKPIRYKNADRKLSTVLEMTVQDFLQVLEREKQISELEKYELPCKKE